MGCVANHPGSFGPAGDNTYPLAKFFRHFILLSNVCSVSQVYTACGSEDPDGKRREADHDLPLDVLGADQGRDPCLSHTDADRRVRRLRPQPTILGNAFSFTRLLLFSKGFTIPAKTAAVSCDHQADRHGVHSCPCRKVWIANNKADAAASGSKLRACDD